MSTLLVPVAPLLNTKTRLRNCFSREQLKDLTIAMFRDMGNILVEVNCFENIIVYCNTSEILELAEEYGLIGIKEVLQDPPKSFDEIIYDFNKVAIEEFNAEQTTLAFLDLILIASKNFVEINDLLLQNQLVVCPAIHSAGISILGRNPPNILPSSFSDPNTPSLVALLNNASNIGLKKIVIYDSFRAGYDIDIKQDLVVAYEYLKIFNLTHTEVFKFLKNNLKFTLKKKDINNNRTFEILDKMD
ncbi:MAG: hypothetical protein ACFFE4_21460 [Candidatus Thorarchaeota archaeon]